MEMPTKIPLLPYMNAYISRKVIFDCCLMGYFESKTCSYKIENVSSCYIYDYMSENERSGTLVPI